MATFHCTINCLHPDVNGRIWFRRVGPRYTGTRVPPAYRQLHVNHVPMKYPTEKECIEKLNRRTQEGFVDLDLPDDDPAKVVLDSRVFLKPDLLPEPYKSQLLGEDRKTNINWDIVKDACQIVIPHPSNVHDPFLWTFISVTDEHL